MSDLDDIAALVYGSPAPAKASEADEAQAQRERLSQAVAALRGSIAVIKEGIATDNLSQAAEAWFELTQDEQQSIWVAPTKGGPFTTSERKVIASSEFRRIHFGDAS